jgi:hypothetical protein
MPLGKLTGALECSAATRKQQKIGASCTCPDYTSQEKHQYIGAKWHRTAQAKSRADLTLLDCTLLFEKSKVVVH